MPFFYHYDDDSAVVPNASHSLAFQSCVFRAIMSFVAVVCENDAYGNGF